MCSCFSGQHLLPNKLSDTTEIPPYRETLVARPLSHCVFCGVADYRGYTPTLLPQYWPIAGLTKGGITAKNMLLKPIAIGGIAEIVLPIALWWDTKLMSKTLSNFEPQAWLANTARFAEGAVSKAKVAIPPLAKESKSSRLKKSKKESPGESLGESRRVLADPPQKSQKRVSWRLCESKLPCFLTLKTIFNSFLGSARTLGDSPIDSPRDSPGDSFFDFLRRGGC